MASQPPFLSLPAELRIKILLQLDTRSLKRYSLVQSYAYTFSG